MNTAPQPPSDGLSGPQQRILDAIAGLNAVGIAHPSKIQAGFWAGYRPSGTFDNYLSKLRTQGLISYPVAGCVALTTEGAAIARAEAARHTHEIEDDAANVDESTRTSEP